ncbi:unnamed protein product [Closterium sp. NIES-54]
MALRPSSVPLHVPLPPPPESSLPAVPDPASDRARATSPSVPRLLATAVTDPSFESAAASALVDELLDFAAACLLDYATALVAESSCEAEIYTRAMAAQELCWLTYLLNDLGERPRSSPVLYVDNKAMIALC